MWTFFPGEQILCPLHGGVPKERFYCNFRQQKKFILTVADDPSYLLRANLLWSLLIGVSSPISFSRAVFQNTSSFPVMYCLTIMVVISRTCNKGTLSIIWPGVSYDLVGSFSIDNGDESEYVTFKVNLRFLNFVASNSTSFPGCSPTRLYVARESLGTRLISVH